MRHLVTKKKLSKKDMVREYSVDCDDVNDLTFEYNKVCWEEKNELRKTLRNRKTKYNQGTITWSIRALSTCSHVKYETSEETGRVGYTMRMPHYGDVGVTDKKIIKQMSKRIFKQIHENKNTWVRCCLSGYREDSFSDVSYVKPIPDVFQQDQYPLTKNCVWLSVAIAIYFLDQSEGYRMLRFLEESPKKYHNLNIWKVKNKVRNNIGSSLKSYLQEIKAKWDLQRLAMDRKKYLNYVLNECTSGIFVCFLKARDGHCEHTITINRERLEIYDCEEEGVLKLNMENLHRCCGGNKCLQSFHMCVLLTEKKEKM